MCSCVKSMGFFAGIHLIWMALNLNGGLQINFPQKDGLFCFGIPTWNELIVSFFTFHRHFLFLGSESGFVVHRAVSDVNRACNLIPTYFIYSQTFIYFREGK